MKNIYINTIAKIVSVAAWRVENCIELIKDGATIPFISRYRKEKTGGLDEEQVALVRENYYKFEELEKRKNYILSSIEEQGKLSNELKLQIENSIDASEIEDLFLPYKPKRRTKAEIARKQGLEKLAQRILSSICNNPKSEASQYFFNGDKENKIPAITTIEAVLEGVRFIIAEKVSENIKVRKFIRETYLKRGMITAKLARGIDEDSDEAIKFKNYFKYKESVSRIASHRALAVLRGVQEGILSVKIEADTNKILDELYALTVLKGLHYSHDTALEIDYAVEDAYKRLLHPSIENEVINIVKDKADIESIQVFGENLRQLLMSPPLGQKRVLAIDPGFRTGCKVVCLDAQGSLLHNDTIYPHPPRNERTMAMKKISTMIEAYNIEVISIGNGTAGRETEAFIKRMMLPEGIKVFSVSEDGASVYSASSIAREEFPDYDVTVRGAVSIGRRLMDPLAELVKIDPKAIGVGQYQHDVDQTKLKKSLDTVVESCVNNVGINLNTASKHLLSYVSGIGPVLAQNIIDYRTENGPFKSRSELHKVKRLGDKVFEQCAGFLRIRDAKNPLDNTSVHPERYALVEKIASDVNKSIPELISGLGDKSITIDIKKYVTDEVGLPTLSDIMNELVKPGRDPRDTIKVFEFSDEIHTIEDLQEGMELPAIVTNITNFGAFVDLGIHEKGLIHVSHMGKKFVNDPTKVVRLQEHLLVRVLSVDIRRSRIGLELVSKL